MVYGAIVFSKMMIMIVVLTGASPLYVPLTSPVYPLQLTPNLGDPIYPPTPLTCHLPIPLYTTTLATTISLRNTPHVLLPSPDSPTSTSQPS